MIAEAAMRFDLSPTWIAAVIRAESAGQVDAVSRKGALGLMQVMPRTYEALRVRYGLGADPLRPRDNILAGSAYLRELLDRYGRAGMLAAYNAGPARYQDFLSGRRGLPRETWAYLAALAPVVRSPPDAEVVAPPTVRRGLSLFAPLTAPRSGTRDLAGSGGLFVALSLREAR